MDVLMKHGRSSCGSPPPNRSNRSLPFPPTPFWTGIDRAIAPRRTNMKSRLTQTAKKDRWAGIVRPYTDNDVQALRGTVRVEHTLARLGAERLWNLLHTEEKVTALGALTGNQAVQQVKAGLQAIYLSG